MRLLTFLLLAAVQSTVILGQEDGPLIITLPIEENDEPKNATDAEHPLNDRFSAIAAELGCSTLELRHKGVRTEEVLRDTIFQPTTTTTTTTTEEPVKHAWASEDDDDAYTSSPENEATEKPSENPSRSRRSTDESNPSTNVTIHHNYSIVRKYPLPENKTESSQKTNVTECAAPFYDNGEEYYWYQIIYENGGAPGEVFNVTRLTPNVTDVVNPCQRPITETIPALEDLLYKYEHIEFERVYRREEAYLRFAGTPSEFVDVRGDFVWSPPGFGRRFYRLEYRKDDSGFYVEVMKGQKCVFSESPVSIKCSQPREMCTCHEGGESCILLRTMPNLLLASLVGG